MNSVIIDFHAGCIQVLASMLLDTNEQIQILSLSRHNYILGKEIENLVLKKEEYSRLVEQIFDADFTFASESDQIKKSVSINQIQKLSAPIYDFAWICFPPAMYRNIIRSGIARHVIIYVSHRMDLWISHPVERKKFWHDFVEDYASGHMTVIAANEYDAAYIKFYSGVSVEVIYPTSTNYLPDSRYDPSKSHEEALLGPSNLVLNRVTRRIQKATGLSTIRQRYSHFFLSDLVRHKAIVLIPYSVYSISMLEISDLALPILVPSNNWLAANSILHDVKLYSHYGKRRDILSFEKSYRKNRHGSPNSKDWNNADYWLKKTFWSNSPNTHYWSSINELRELLSSSHVKQTWSSMESSINARTMKFAKFVNGIRLRNF